MSKNACPRGRRACALGCGEPSDPRQKHPPRAPAWIACGRPAMQNRGPVSLGALIPGAQRPRKAAIAFHGVHRRHQKSGHPGQEAGRMRQLAGTTAVPAGTFTTQVGGIAKALARRREIQEPRMCACAMLELIPIHPSCMQHPRVRGALLLGQARTCRHWTAQAPAARPCLAVSAKKTSVRNGGSCLSVTRSLRALPCAVTLA